MGQGLVSENNFNTTCSSGPGWEPIQGRDSNRPAEDVTYCLHSPLELRLSSEINVLTGCRGLLKRPCQCQQSSSSASPAMFKYQDLPDTE